MDRTLREGEAAVLAPDRLGVLGTSIGNDICLNTRISVDYGEGKGTFVTRKEEVEHLLRRSKEFLETARYQINQGFYDLAVFSLEQAPQLSLKSKMLASGTDYPRTHSVRALLQILSDLVPDDEKPSMKQMLDEHLFELGILEDAYITSRYVMRRFSREEAQSLLKVVEEVMQNVA